MSSPTADELAGVPLFAELSQVDRARIAERFEVRTFAAGQHLTHEDAHGYTFSVLASGTADVVVGTEVIATLRPGDYFGEMSLLFGRQQTATVAVTTPAVVWRMFGADFRQLQQDQPQVAAVIAETAAERRAALPSTEH